MKDISYHILDIVQNSLNAGANAIEISLEEKSGQLTLCIADNGAGMNDEVIRQVTDPFFTSSTTKKVGMGLPLLKQNAEITGGSFEIRSEVGKGTTVTTVFNHDNIDMIPLGDMALTFKTLIAGNPEKDFIYRHVKNGEGFSVDTSEIRQSLEGISLKTPDVLDFLAKTITENLKALELY